MQHAFPLLTPDSTLAAALHGGIRESWKGGCSDFFSFSQAPKVQRRDREGVNAGRQGGMGNVRGQGTPAGPWGSEGLSQKFLLPAKPLSQLGAGTGWQGQHGRGRGQYTNLSILLGFFFLLFCLPQSL